ncbi:MAG: ATP12 family protein [Pseudomonadota bacterium]
MTIPTHTPAKKPFAVPTRALQEAIEKEWSTGKKFSPGTMPLTSLVYTAIDQIDEKENIVEVLLAYIDTDTLSYRSANASLLAEQKKQWDPVLVWAGSKFNALWQTTTGVMPLDQPEALHAAIKEYLLALDAMRLAACCSLASGYSSLVLAIAVMEKHLSAARAYDLSRLEEEAQAAQWGRDEEADERSRRMQAEIVETGHFLRLLEAA